MLLHDFIRQKKQNVKYVKRKRNLICVDYRLKAMNCNKYYKKFEPEQSIKFEKNPLYVTLKSYSNRKYKLIGSFCEKRKAKKFDSWGQPIDYLSEYMKLKKKKNDKKLDESISRAKSKIYEYALCNEFEYFLTLTIDPKKYDRKNLQYYYKHFSKFLQNYKKKYSLEIFYILVPEKHKDNTWHMHGLIKGIPESHFTQNKNGYLDWLPYHDRFGYISLSKIKNHEAISKYITKYVTKDMSNTVQELNHKIYYASRNLEKAVVMKKGILSESIPIHWDYSNHYCALKQFDKEFEPFLNEIILDIVPYVKAERKIYVPTVRPKIPNLFDFWVDN